MVLKIIDVSSYQDVSAIVTPGTQGVIVKATQGTDYVNPMCDLQYQLAKAHGMVLGLYHYLSGDDAKAEAAYFCANTEGYWKNDMVTMWADWESGQNTSWGDGKYVATFIAEVNRIIGVQCCGLYTGLKGIKQCRNLSDTVPLWFAGYPDLRDSWEAPDFIYDVAPWKFVTMWQFTNSNGKLDRSMFYGEIDTWVKLSTKGGNPDQDPIPVPLPISNDGHNVAARNLEDLASGVLSGEFGTGDVRCGMLSDKYGGVQAIVEERMGTLTADDVHQILAKETLSGVYGDGDARKFVLGSYYDTVQSIINGSNSSNDATYVVQSGDTLSGIASTYGVSVESIQAANGIADPDQIFAGESLIIK